MGRCASFTFLPDKFCFYPEGRLYHVILYFKNGDVFDSVIKRNYPHNSDTCLYRRGNRTRTQDCTCIPIDRIRWYSYFDIIATAAFTFRHCEERSNL